MNFFFIVIIVFLPLQAMELEVQEHSELFSPLNTSTNLRKSRKAGRKQKGSSLPGAIACPWVNCGKNICFSARTSITSAVKSHYAVSHFTNDYVKNADIKFNEETKKYETVCNECGGTLHGKKCTSACLSNLKKHIVNRHAELPDIFLQAITNAEIKPKNSVRSRQNACEKENGVISTQTENVALNLLQQSLNLNTVLSELHLLNSYSVLCIGCGLKLSHQDNITVKNSYMSHLMTHNIELDEHAVESSIQSENYFGSTFKEPMTTVASMVNNGLIS